MKRTAWIVVGWLVLGDTAQAASFDCSKAKTKVEKLICGDAELSRLDEELSAAYKAALQDIDHASAIKQAQKKWIRERNGCADATYVQKAYRMRLTQLTSTQQAAERADTALSPAMAEEACLAPKIDWRNYEWMLITGNGIPVCDEMLAYVKSRPSDVAPPTCPGERLPPNGNWTRPKSRILNEAEKQALLRDIPERWQRQKGGSLIGDYAHQIQSSKLLRVIRGDITRDGVPESLLAFNSHEDPQHTCERSKRCAVSNKVFTDAYKNQIWLTSDSYDLLPMNDAGTQVNWSHGTVRAAPMLMGGELIYYKGLPYWLSGNVWGQASHDDFAHSSMRADDPYSAIFGLNGFGHSVIGQYGGEVKPAPFSEVKHIRGDGAICRFGYFHRNNLKQNPPKARR